MKSLLNIQHFTSGYLPHDKHRPAG